MPAHPDQPDRLRDLHDDYVWKVNAAVAEGRPDLVRRLSGEYTEEALHMLTGGTLASACTRPDCPACTRPRPAPPPPRRGWRLLAHRLGWRPPG